MGIAGRDEHRPAWSRFTFSMGTRTRFLDGTGQGLGTPLFSCRPSITATVISQRSGGRDRRASWRATGRGNDPSIPESLFGKAPGGFCGPVSVRDGRVNAAEWPCTTRSERLLESSTGSFSVSYYGRNCGGALLSLQLDPLLPFANVLRPCALD